MRTLDPVQLQAVSGGQALESRSQLLQGAISDNYPLSAVEFRGQPSFSGAKGTQEVRTSALFGLGRWVDRTCTANVYKEDQRATGGVYNLKCD